MENLTEKFSKVDSEILHPVRAKYYRDKDGNLFLASVQKFSDAKFREEGWESREAPKKRPRDVEDENEEGNLYANIERATRRAKIHAFDAIMCNHDLDTFCTFTYSPEAVDDKADYAECYKYLGVWLSNRVQRRGLKYVLVPERTKIGDIHFHAIMNSSALKLVQAYGAHSGKPLTHNGKPLFNLQDWKKGFSSCEPISTGDGDRRAVAKYIFKYMGKQIGQKIGGRYVLTGGDLIGPKYAYGDNETEFFVIGDESYSRMTKIGGDGVDLIYQEWSFI